MTIGLLTTLLFEAACGAQKTADKDANRNNAPVAAAVESQAFYQSCVAEDRSPDDATTLAALKDSTGLQDCHALTANLVARTGLTLTRRNLTSIKILATLPGLHELYLDHNLIGDLSPLASLPDLEVLTLSDNLVSDVTVLAGLPGLQTLDLSENPQIVSVSPLQGLVKLKSLYIAMDSIHDLTPLAGLAALVALDASSNKIDDLAPLASLTGLVWLAVGGFEALTDLRPLAALSVLETLRLPYAGLKDLSPLVGLQRLKVLDLVGNQISDVGALGGLVALEKLELSNNALHTVAPLGHLVNLLQISFASSRNTITKDDAGCPTLSNSAVLNQACTAFRAGKLSI